jgi:hypothetical protein
MSPCFFFEITAKNNENTRNDERNCRKAEFWIYFLFFLVIAFKLTFLILDNSFKYEWFGSGDYARNKKMRKTNFP